jgi:hypothetical protein
MKKTYCLKFTKSSMSKSQERYIKGTLDGLNSYYGKQAKSITTLVKQVNKDYDWQYGCTYTVASVEVVDILTIPAMASVSEATERTYA